MMFRKNHRNRKSVLCFALLTLAISHVDIFPITTCDAASGKKDKPPLVIAKSKEDMVDLVRQAIQKKKVKLLMDLTFWEGVPKTTKEQVKMLNGMLIGGKLKDITIKPWPKGKSREYKTNAKGENLYKYNLQPTEQLLLSFVNPDPNRTVGPIEMAIGSINERYYIVVGIPVEK